ncbi:MAG: Gldg family protein [Chakrabartia sp.]
MHLVWLILALTACSGPAPASVKPQVHVLTALPLFWGEGGIEGALSQTTVRSPFLVALDADYVVQPIDALDSGQLRQVKMLIAIQPGAMPPEDWVSLDSWVRGGGKALIFADPDLIWPTDLPLGDKRRAPQSTLLDPVFAHWGVRLEGVRGSPVIRSVTMAGHDIALLNAGKWVLLGKDCVLSDAGLVADCAIGNGRAILVADADMIDPRLWAESQQDNLGAVTSLIKRLENNVRSK